MVRHDDDDDDDKTWLKYFQPWNVPAELGSIVVTGAQTSFSLLHFLCDLKVE